MNGIPHRCFLHTLAVLNKIHSFALIMARMSKRFKVKFTSQGHHQNHQILQVFRNVYKDVVCLAALETYIDCSKIQPFKCNKRLVLNCLPLCGSTSDDAASCNISRKSKEAQSYQYCSIACMVKSVSRKSDDSVPSISSIQAPSHESRVEISEPSKRKRKRKGTPHRAPLF
ncbi:unnamed protein product [Lathyrus oleraceus]|uniref:protein RGF1 INDUCIBLE TRANSCRIPTION FACTOR 1 isoform X3 n=1 Tax=Pisum sativum TaxID=3888 RepID=UPI0021D2E20E|nr:protein RGF1 INDUCIBLE TRANSCRIPTION FACTOR 1-like isoform X3 [Pisum sativum]